MATDVPYDLHEPLVVRRQGRLARARLPVRDQQHGAPATPMTCDFKMAGFNERDV